MSSLKSLALSGFKSFGKTTVFEFPTAVTAIVGPNGSGKSNVAEAIRWVLGEQSMKSLRGKKGEDLIFNGSESSARLSRAEVKLIFDNSNKKFSLDFDDIVIARRVSRDGTNEYLLNGSPVRLRDIAELLAGVGLGSAQHHIISQGEVDRILWASGLERQEMIEEALSLKSFHLKKRETERKLTETETNMKQIDAVRRELLPHLKFLSTQAEKMKAHEDFQKELAEKALLYASREKATLEAAGMRIRKEKAPLEAELQKKESTIKELNAVIKSSDKSFAGLRVKDDARRQLEELKEKERRVNRELGRMEGLLAGSAGVPSAGATPAAFIAELRDTLSLVNELAGIDSFEALKSGILDIRSRLERMLKISTGERESGGDSGLEKKQKLLLSELKSLEAVIAELQEKQRENESVREDLLGELRERERDLRTHERELESIKEKLRVLGFEEEREHARAQDLKLFIHDLKVSGLDEHAKPFDTDAERTNLMRSIERLRIKLEEAGGIDTSVVKEYEDTKTRAEFLARELDDLTTASKSLRGLMKELDLKLEEKFSDGIKKINEEFKTFFHLIFGGGKASVHRIKPSVTEEGEQVSGGVDISVDIPRKRLRSLDMLSGGERALTSIALLFAISTVNPPPFLVLDETDAALDEANSQKYADLLKDLSVKTQLIVITHNRTTMQRAGVLYGVTLGRDGASNILSLKFDAAVEYAKEG